MAERPTWASAGSQTKSCGPHGCPMSPLSPLQAPATSLLSHPDLVTSGSNPIAEPNPDYPTIRSGPRPTHVRRAPGWRRFRFGHSHLAECAPRGWVKVRPMGLKCRGQTLIWRVPTTLAGRDVNLRHPEARKHESNRGRRAWEIPRPPPPLNPICLQPLHAPPPPRMPRYNGTKGGAPTRRIALYASTW